MEENIIVNDEIMETTSEVIESTGSGNGLKVLGGVALIVGLAYGGWRLIKKIKNRKNAEVETVDCVEEKFSVDVDED